MKNTIHIAIAATAIVLAMTGCAKVNEPDAPEGQEITITATFEENQTKTTLQDGGTTVYWESGDEIKVFYGSGTGRFASKNSTPVASTEFSGSINIAFGNSEGFSDGNYMWGLYPFRSDATFDGEYVTTIIPDEQIGKSGSFGKNYNVTIAKSPNLSLCFYNVCGGLRFSLTHEGVNEVVFESLGGESIAGKVKLGFNGNVPEVQEVVEGVSSITLTAPSGDTFEVGKWYYIVALPGILESGFKMTFNTEKQYATLKSSSSVTVKRSVFGSLTNVDEDLVYKDKGTPEPGGDIIVFKDPAAKYACVEKFDTNGDGEVSYEEAAAVKSIAGLFDTYNAVKTFEEIQYFTGITSMENAFQGKTKLVSLTIPAFIKQLNSSEFQGCTKLSTVRLPSEVTSIPSSCFYNCQSLKDIELPEAIIEIAAYAFYGCSSLSEILLPKSLGTLGREAFYGCSLLKRINIPEGIKIWGTSTFYDCSKLTSVSIESGITSIPDKTFMNCSSLADISLPNTIVTIGKQAFYNVNVWKLELPMSVVSIGDECINQIQNVIVPSDNFVSILSRSFANTWVFVPDKLYNMYIFRVGWSDIQSRIYPISHYLDKDKYELLSEGACAMNMIDGVKWAAFNLGASKPEEKGNGYAWGEIEPKETYSWENYKWCNGSEKNLTKYNTDESYGTVDDKTVLDLEDDAAHIVLGGNWRIPTKNELADLCNTCIWEWGSINSIKGYFILSPAEGKKIFFPCDGYNGGDVWGLYTTSEISKTRPSERSGYLLFDWQSRGWVGGYSSRPYPASIRPVLQE